MIDYVGAISSSKSLMNRSLIIQSLNPGFTTLGASESDDVSLMQDAVAKLNRIGMSDDQVYDCGHAGTVFRFLAFRLAREKGTFDLRGSKRLFSRPQNEIQKCLAQLGVFTQFETQSGTGEPFMRIQTTGWHPQGDGVFISGKESSQYASGLLLSAWDLPFSLAFTFNGPIVSADYFLMTVKLCRQLGMDIQGDGREWYVPARSRTKVSSYNVEMDVSSAFTLAALAVMSGHASLVDFPQVSLQPDAVFLEYFRHMGIPYEFDGANLKIARAESWQGLTADLNRHPDLLPVLSVLCSFAKTDSRLTGLGHLAFKESNRLEKSKELVEKLGARADICDNGTSMTITPTGKHDFAFSFDPDQDHRMAMAAAVANARGAKVDILNKSVVTKSFPEFWQIAGSP